MNNIEIQDMCIVVSSQNGAQLPHESLFLVSCVFNTFFNLFRFLFFSLSKEDKSLIQEINEEITVIVIVQLLTKDTTGDINIYTG
jgi:hypothetical protein